MNIQLFYGSVLSSATKYALYRNWSEVILLPLTTSVFVKVFVTANILNNNYMRKWRDGDRGCGDTYNGVSTAYGYSSFNWKLIEFEFEFTWRDVRCSMNIQPQRIRRTQIERVCLLIASVPLFTVELVHFSSCAWIFYSLHLNSNKYKLPE